MPLLSLSPPSLSLHISPTTPSEFIKEELTMKKFEYDEVKKATKDFSLDHLVGKGSHGRVYKAVLGGGKAIFAVKKPSAASSAYLDNEIDILSSYTSPNIVNLVGLACDCIGSRLLLIEYMPNGSLEKLLQVRLDPPELAWRVAAAIQAGRALVELHRANPPIIHRDVKSSNILFDGRGRARLADFSLAVRVGGPSRPAAGTMGYIDPGYIGSGQLGEGVDVFSFGVVLMELAGGRRATEEKGAGEGVVGRLAAMAARCMEVEGGRRPGMEEVVEGLERAAERVWWPLGVVRRWVKRGRRMKVVGSATGTVCNKELIEGDNGSDENRN